METLELRGYVIEHDREATVAAYAQIARSGADICTCSCCENFAALRSKVYPEEFLTLLERLGIDPLKENGVYECGRNESSQHFYGGWFHFIGKVIREGLKVGSFLHDTRARACRSASGTDEFRYSFAPEGRLPKTPAAFTNHATAAIEFVTWLPWVISRPEPD